MTSKYMQSSSRHENRTQMARRFGFPTARTNSQTRSMHVRDTEISLAVAWDRTAKTREKMLLVAVVGTASNTLFCPRCVLDSALSSTSLLILNSARSVRARMPILAHKIALCYEIGTATALELRLLTGRV